MADTEDGAIKGRWRIVDGSLVSPIRWPAQFHLPVVPPQEYDLEIVAKRQAGEGPLVFAITVDGRRTMVGLDHDRDWLILHNVDGKGELSSEAKTRRKSLPSGVVVPIVIRIRQAHITVNVNGATLLEWQGDFDRLGPNGFFSPGPGATLGVSSYAGEFAISRLRLTPIGGLVKLDPTRSVPSLADRKATRRVLALGGSVVVTTSDGVPRKVTHTEDLPRRIFHVQSIEDLGQCQLTQADFQRFAGLKGLQRLDLKYAFLDEADLEQVLNIPSLNAVLLNESAGLTSKGLAAIGRMHQLRLLDLQD